jgi:hypothetical protein
VKRTRTLVLAALVGAASLVPLVRAQQAQPSAPPEDPLLAGFRRSTVASVSDAVDQVVGRRGFLTHEIRPLVAGTTGTIVGLMGTAAKARGMEGMVLDGGVRDLAELRALNLPVYARSVTPATAVGRFASVARDVPVECGGVTIRPGDIVVAGEDGVVVVPQEKAADVLKRSQEIDERETKMVPFIKQQRSLQKVIELFNRI